MLEQYKESQPIAYRILSKTLKSNHFAHAYLFETNGYNDGLKLAKTFAKLILCPNNLKYSNCDNCLQCNMIDENNFLELKIIDPEGMVIKKEQLLELQEEFNKKSILGNKKVYIINRAERLNNNSANTILKFLEEPQEGVIAILITSNMYQLLETIISRCQIISLNGQADIEKNAKTLIKIGKILTEDDESFEKFTNDENNVEKINAILKFIDYYENNHKKVLLHLNEYWFKYFNDKENISKALMIIIYFYKDVLNYKIDCEIEVFNDYIENISKIANLNTIEQLINKLDLINENKLYIENNANLNLLMDKILISMEEGVR